MAGSPPALPGTGEVLTSGGDLAKTCRGGGRAAAAETVMDRGEELGLVWPEKSLVGNLIASSHPQK